MLPGAVTLSIRLFGPMHVVVNGSEVTIPGGKVQSLLAYLLLYPQSPHTRDTLIDALWPEQQADRARRALADTLYRLRATLGVNCLQTSGDLIGLERQVHVEVDVWAFEAASTGTTALDLDRARALYTAPLLPDIYDEWIVVRRVALQQKFDAVLEQRAQIAEETGDLPAAREMYQILVANDPFYEASWRGLMRSLARMGYFRDALDAYERLAKLLDDEIGAPAEQATRELAANIEREFAAQHMLPATSRPIALAGRVRERSRLVALVEAAASGRGGIAVILGEAGIGRTRLLEELNDAADWRGIHVVTGASESGAFPDLFAPLRQALLAALPAARQEQLRDLVPPHWLEVTQELLADFVADSQPASPSPRHEAAPAYLAQAVGALLRGLGSVLPHLILLDDVQWADPSFWHLLDTLHPYLNDARVLLVLSGRTGELRTKAPVWSLLTRWDQTSTATVLALGAMSRTEIAQMLHAQPLRRLNEDEMSAILDACGGNPMLAMALAEDSTWQGAEEVPPEIHQVVLRRYSAFPHEERIALHAAAVLGTRIPYGLWRSVWEAAGHPAASLSTVAGELERQHHLHMDGDSYRFILSPLRAAILESMPAAERSEWHRHALHGLRSIPETSPVLLLRHAHGAGDPAATATFALQAGEAALLAHALESAREYFSIALDHLAATDHESRYRALMGRSRALAVLGMRDEQQEDLRCLQDLVTRLPDESKQALVAYRMAGYLWSIGKLDEALAVGQSGLLLAESLRDDHLRARLHEVIGRIQRDNKHPDDATFHIELARKLYHQLDDRWGQAVTTDLEGGLAWDRGRYAEAAVLHRAAADLFHAEGDIVLEAQSLNNLGSTYWALEDYAGARATHERALEVCRTAGDRRGEADNTDNLGGVAWSLGDYDAAIQHYGAALRIRRALHDIWGIAISLGNLGSAWLRKGHAQTAADYYRQSYPLYQQVGRKRGEGYVLHGMGSAELAGGNPAAALEWLHKALDVRTEVGDASRIIETKAALARAFLAAGDQAAALRTLEDALSELDSIHPRATLRQEVHCAAYEIFAAARLHGEARQQLALADHALSELCSALRVDEREGFLANVPLNQLVIEARQKYMHQVIVPCVRTGVPLGRAPRAHEMIDVTWTLETPADQLLDEGAARRRHVIQRLLAEAREQGAAATDADLAAVLSVSRRTILRDMAALAESGVTLPTRARA